MTIPHFTTGAGLMPATFQTPDLTEITMPRSHASARTAGQKFERAVADYLKDELGDDRIDIRPKNGKNDRGDIGGIKTIRGGAVVIECKNVKTMTLGSWVNEAERERGNADAAVGIVVHKRHGNGSVGEQFATMTLETLARLIDGGAE